MNMFEINQLVFDKVEVNQDDKIIIYSHAVGGIKNLEINLIIKDEICQNQ